MNKRNKKTLVDLRLWQESLAYTKQLWESLLFSLETTKEQLVWMLQERQQVEELALQAEATVRQLSGLPPAKTKELDLIEILNHICLLLDRFVAHPEQLAQQKAPISEVVTPTGTRVNPAPEPEPKLEPEPTLSETAEEQIKLRDGVLLAKSEGDSSSSKVLEAIYKKLGEILTHEKVTPLEEMGLFDYEKQKVMSTKATNDLDKNDCICDIVRPGYLFNGGLVRPQEVIVYTYESKIVTTEESVVKSIT